MVLFSVLREWRTTSTTILLSNRHDLQLWWQMRGATGRRATVRGCGR